MSKKIRMYVILKLENNFDQSTLKGLGEKFWTWRKILIQLHLGKKKVIFHMQNYTQIYTS